MGVTVSAVSQWERGEDSGSATLGTINSALEAMGARAAVLAVPADPPSPVLFDVADCAGVPVRGAAHRERALFRARSRMRNAAIAGDALVTGIALTPEELWLVCDQVTVAAPQREVQRARAIRDSFDAIVAAVSRGTYVPTIRLPDGRTVEPDVIVRSLFPRAVHFSATAIYNGADPVTARHAMGGYLIDNGYGWIVLRADVREDHQRAVDLLATTGDARPFAKLMTACYDEED